MARSESEDKQAPTQADIDAAEALGSAIAEAAGEQQERPTEVAKKPKKQKKPAKKKPAKAQKASKAQKVGDWSGVDQILAFVLLANLALMAVLVLTGGDPEKPEENRTPMAGNTQEGGQEELFKMPGEFEKPEKAEGERSSRVPVIPRSALWDEAIRQAMGGDLPKAIALLEKLLVEDDGVKGVVRRTVYMQLSYYYGMSGNPERSRHFQVLATRGHMTGLGPEQLWKLGEEALALGDIRGARGFYARYLLQRARMSDELAEKIPMAYLRLADSYRDEAAGRRASGVRPGKSPTVPAGAAK